MAKLCTGFCMLATPLPTDIIPFKSLSELGRSISTSNIQISCRDNIVSAGLPHACLVMFQSPLSDSQRRGVCVSVLGPE